MFVPEIVSTLKGYTRRQLVTDLQAGVIVGIVYGIVQKYGVDGLTVATLMAGVILIALGAFRLGAAIKFVAHPVVIGFTSGIAVVIFSSQVKDVLGLRMGAVRAPFVEKWQAYFTNLGSANWYALAIAGASLVVM